MGSINLPKAQLSELPPIRKRNSQEELILQVLGNNPIAQGINAAAPDIADALARRRERQMETSQLASAASAVGEDPNAYKDLNLEMGRAMLLESLKRKKEAEVFEKEKAFELEKFNREKAFELEKFKMDKNKPVPLKAPQYIGMTEDGQPISYDPNTRTLSTPAQSNYTGIGLPKTVGTEEQRRIALVTGAEKSIADIRDIVTNNPDTLSELKAIKLTPGRVYSQLASSDAKRLYINLREAISNEIYLKTGATANEQELENSTVSYMAALNDNPADFLGRMELLERNILPFNSRAGTPLRTIDTAKPASVPGQIGRFKVKVK